MNYHRSSGWTPQLRDGIYCSPQCGAGCTQEAYLRAKREGDRLAERMGPGWHARVWENFGWHYEARCGDVRITVQAYVGGAISYTAWIEPAANKLGAAPQFIASAATPEDALGFAVQDARSLVAMIEQTLHAVLEASA